MATEIMMGREAGTKKKRPIYLRNDLVRGLARFPGSRNRNITLALLRFRKNQACVLLALSKRAGRTDTELEQDLSEGSVYMSYSIDDRLWESISDYAKRTGLDKEMIVKLAIEAYIYGL
jgi:hypothetical protein